NLGALSLMLNKEASVVLVRYDTITSELRDAIAAAFIEGREIDAARYAERRRIERMMNWLAYKTDRIVMKALTVGGYD
ncbi:cardiolipin synthase B, partial [Burkholderia thailandensis]|nr:cardiolipin synthase B [Burkholderia thailandensis]